MRREQIEVKSTPYGRLATKEDAYILLDHCLQGVYYFTIKGWTLQPLFQDHQIRH
jgi:hypothetical protein